MYHSKGNYEAFARPQKPAGVDAKSAYLVGGGLASLAAAAFLIRDGQMAGDRITILEATSTDGGALDGAGDEHSGWLIRGGREMESAFECLWDLYRSIPSLEIEGASVLDEFYWLNKADPNFSLQRTTEAQGKDSKIGKTFTLNHRARKDIVKLVLALPETLYDKRIDEVMSAAFFTSNFWLYWRTMFAFEQWHSALEMKLYVQRFIHQIVGLPDFSTLKFTKYNQYESLALPLVIWLLSHGVTIQHNTKVMNVKFDIGSQRKCATRIDWIKDGVVDGVDITENELVFVTNGSLVENADWGDHKTPAKFLPEVIDGGSWHLWRNIAAQDPSFGRPDKFCTSPEQTQWESATVTTLDECIPAYMEKIAKRGMRTGCVVTGGIVTAKDSSWLLSWTVNRQPHFSEQPDSQTVVWVYGLFTDVPGDFVKKSMRDCTGEEITQEWLYHMGVPAHDIKTMASSGAITRPCMMPFITAFFMPRTKGDRPEVVPEHAVNFAFIGQFAETSRDCAFTTECSVRTAMEGVYQLLDVDRGVPEVFGSIYDVRELMKSTALLRDGKKLPIPDFAKKYVKRTIVGRMLEEYGVI